MSKLSNEEGGFLYKYQIFYSPSEKPKMEKFKQFCRTRGYRPIVAITTLLDYIEYHRHLEEMAIKVSELTTKVMELESFVKDKEKTPKEEDTSPKTMGGNLDSP